MDYIHPNDPRYEPDTPEVKNILIDEYKEEFSKILKDLETLKQREVHFDVSDTNELDAGLNRIKTTLNFYL
jgi:hypothetical protein